MPAARAPNPYEYDRNQLIRDHMDMARRLACKIARRTPRSVRCDELESAAMLGLTEAASRFDPTRSEPFVAFAAKRIRGAVLDELRRNDVLTRRGREGARRLADAIRSVEAQVGRPATTDEIAQQMGVSVEQVAQFRARLQTPTLVPLEEVRDIPRTADGDTPDEQFMLCEQKQALAKALQSLPQRDLLVLSLYYQQGVTLKGIGQILGVSESRTCQLRGRALRKLRKFIES